MTWRRIAGWFWLGVFVAWIIWHGQVARLSLPVPIIGSGRIISFWWFVISVGGLLMAFARQRHQRRLAKIQLRSREPRP